MLKKQSKPIGRQSAACSQASAASISASSRSDLQPHGRLKSPTSRTRCCATAFRTPDNSAMCAPAYPSCGRLTLSSADSLVRTFRQWAKERDSQAREQVCFSMPCTSSPRSNRAGWYWKMSPACSFQTMAETSRSSLKRLPNAGTWDFGGCLTLVISESPRAAAEFSYSQVWESSPHWSLWLTPGQWNAFLERRRRAARGRTLTLPCLQVSPSRTVSTSRAAISQLSATDGVRWLSGSERLKLMGFVSDWVRPTLQRLMLPETPSVRRLPAGLRKNSSKHSD